MSIAQHKIVEAMKNTGMIPVFYHPDIEIAKAVMKASYEGGVRVFEFTNRGENAFEVFKALLVYAQQFDGLYLGIGTIMDQVMAKRFIEVGAHFLVSPIFKQELAKIGIEHNLMMIPGCATLTEIVTAKEAGANVIKVFPGSVLGPGFVSSIMPVVPGLQLMPTGGVEPSKENLSAWFKAGVVCVGMGSQLFKKELIDQQKWAELTLQVAQTLSIIKNIRS